MMRRVTRIILAMIGMLGLLGIFAATPMPQGTPPFAGTPTATPSGASLDWVTVQTTRFSILLPASFQTRVPLRDVRLRYDTAQMILLGEDRETGLKIELTETPALFANAQRKLENRKNDFNYARDVVTGIETQTGITLNGYDAAMLAYTRAGRMTVEWFIVVGAEEFDFVFERGRVNDQSFIEHVDKIVRSFLVDANLATPTPVPDKPTVWNTERTQRFSIAYPANLDVPVALRDVRLKPDSAQLVFMAEDPNTGWRVIVMQSPALYGSAQKKLEDRKKDLDLIRPNEQFKLLKLQADAMVNGRPAALVEYVRQNSVQVEYFIVVGEEEFEIRFQYGKPDDLDFISSAERIANSFTIDTK